MNRLLCALGRHDWHLISTEALWFGGPAVVHEVCGRPWCRGRIQRWRWSQ